MTKNIKLLELLFMIVWTVTAHANYYNNVRVNDTPVRCLAQTDDELIWLGTGNGLYCYDGYRAIPRHGFSNAMRPTIYSMLSNGHQLYLGTSNGFYIYDTITGLYDEPVQLRKEVRALEKVNQNIVLGLHDGLWEYDTASRRMRLLSNDFRDIYSILYVDGVIYAGTLKGLYAYSKGKSVEVKLNNVETPSVFSLLSDRQRQCIWVGTGDMLYQFAPTDGSVRKLTEMNDVSVKAMSLADDHSLFIATDNGINHYDEATGKMRMIVISDKSDKHNARWAYDLIDDGSGRMWVGAYSGGIFIISKEKLLACGGFVVADNHLDCGKGGLSFLWVRQLAKDSHGHIWARTGNGLDRIDIASLKVDNVAKSDPGCMSADKYGNIWTANTNELLCYGNSGKPQRHSYGVMQENVETVALCEMNGQIWAVTNGECLIFSNNDGHELRRLHIPIVNAYGAFYSSAGKRLYIGGQDGIVEFLNFRGYVYGRIYKIRLFLQMLSRGLWHDTISIYQEYKSLKQ